MPQRICILGNAGSGKSTLANALGEKLNIPVFHLDREMHYGNFNKHSAGIRDRIHSELINKNEWIIEGNYHPYLPDRVKRATLVVYLDVSRLIVFGRVVRRAKTKHHPKNSIPEGANEARLSWGFIKWTLKYSRRQRFRALERLARLSPGVKLLKLKPGTVDNWVDQVLSQIS